MWGPRALALDDVVALIYREKEHHETGKTKWSPII